ncbi:sugar/nucleoside kinase (ribokinase family) [Kribbella aluminosa]|uniref:Sugar/nucleoside kinase (Ribokinase family) n=1 Tax=Kribbella aluminosa TaxID=416017 RepID=A0ABS4UCG5_9ACTN|nr:carbohydrate kinase family protein [Kribbella aluminosa]MBP2349301.1 sugar/nucleoside kinase (ribokinase family) [Kribbella aluminosa]
MTVVGVRGGLSVDHLVNAGQSARFDELGGPGLFATLGARLVAGTRVRLYSRLPDDEPRFAKLFDELGIDTSGCIGDPQAMRLWILNSQQGRRIVATAPVGSVELESGETATPEEETPVPLSEEIDGLLDSSPVERALVGSARIGVDPHQLRLQAEGAEYVRRVTPPGGLVLPSRVQLRLIDPDPLAAARTLHERFGFDVIARLDRDGLVAISGDGEWAVRDPDVQVVETTGAGDSSAGAILAAWAAGADLPTAAAYGAAVARLVLSDWGHAGLLTDPLTEPFPTITITRKQ